MLHVLTISFSELQFQFTNGEYAEIEDLLECDIVEAIVNEQSILVCLSW